MQDSDWNAANAMVIPAQAAIGVYESGDEILIVQQGEMGERDDVVSIHKVNLPALIKELSRHQESF